MGCVWGEGELWEQSYNLAILTEKNAKQNNRKPQNNNKKIPPGMWSEFKASYYGNIDKLERVQKQREQRKKASEGLDYPRREAEKSQGWKHFREEQVEASGAGMDIWDLAGSSTSVPSPPHRSRAWLSSHFTALSRYDRISRENIHRDCQKEHPWPGELGTFPQGKS